MIEPKPGFDADDVQLIDNVLRDTSVDGLTRGAILKSAAAAAFVGGGLFGTARRALGASYGTSDSVQELAVTATTAEALAVTYLTAVLYRLNEKSGGEIGGVPVKTVGQVLRAANATEAAHYNLLHSPNKMGKGFQPLTTKFWIPNAALELKNVPATIEYFESLFVNAYALGITIFARSGLTDMARIAGEILGTEAQHLALARFLQGKLPNNVAFMQAPRTTVGEHVAAIEAAGVGFGKRGSKPGAFFRYGGTGSQRTKITGLLPD